MSSDGGSQVRLVGAALSVERTVEIVEDDPRSERRSLRLRDLPDDVCVLILGDPGSGKTTCMVEAASVCGGIFVPVRQFLARPTGWVTPGTPLILDALDEALAGGPSNPADAVAWKLHECGQPRFWLSCRPVDWAALAGTRVLRDAAGSRPLLRVRLLPLDDAGVEALVRAGGQDPAEFLQQVEEARLTPLLRNPQTLLLMLDVASRGGGLPSSRRTLYETAADLLAREANRERPRLHHAGRPPPPAALLDAAGLACSALLLADRDAVSLDSSTDQRDVSLDDLDPEGTNGDALRAALASRLFSGVGEGRFAPQHRTVAEFLAARFLARRVGERGLPLRRVEALLCGRNPEPHPSLRGLFAWVATLLPSRAESLVRLDPYGVLAYGDPSEFGPAALHALLGALADLERRDPFFRSDLWGEARLAALASPALAGALREILESRPWPGQLAWCVLEALSDGQALPELAPTLSSVVLDASVPEDGRAGAIPALLRACTLPIEAKGEWHPELWTAWRDQLGEGYAREPSSAGRGVYLVFWCGLKRLAHPGSGDIISNPVALEGALQNLVNESGDAVRVVVMDVSPPLAPSARRSTPTPRQPRRRRKAAG